MAEFRRTNQEQKQSITDTYTPEQRQAAITAVKNASNNPGPNQPNSQQLIEIGKQAADEIGNINRSTELFRGIKRDSNGNPIIDNKVPSTLTRPDYESSQNYDKEKGVYNVNIKGYTSIDSEEQSVSPLSSTPTSSDIGDARTNPLNIFANYTYGLSLRALTIADYNSIVDDPKKVRDVSNKNVLIASGGRRSAELQRSENFNDDFFFDNFKMTSIIGLNARSRGSNVIDMSFTIIEPYGITLINRILKEAEKLNIQRWDEMPFLMVIEFFGNTDGGELRTLSEHTKYLPIRIIEIKIKLTVQGAEYQVNAVPYNHQAYSETMAVTPINVEVTAGTVKDFFSASGDSGEVSNIENKTQSAKERLEQTQAEIESLRGDLRSSAISDAKSRASADTEKEISEIRKTRYKVGSYAAAINEYYASLKEKNIIEKSDTFSFSIDKEISDSTITKKENNTVRTAPMAKNSKEKEQVELAKLVNPINAGTNIIEVINQAIRSSTYITNQIDLEKKNQSPSNEPINWFKIVPKVKIGDFDTKRQIYQKDIVYHVSKYTYYNNKYPFTKNLGNPTKWVKEYNYIFTGKNDAIIDLNIDFNTAFYLAIQSFKGKTKEGIGPSPGEKTSSSDKNNTTSKTKEDTPTTTKPGIDPVRIVAVSGVNETAANKDIKTDAANDLFKSVLSSARGDMINIQMKILGDPEFVKQDDLLYTPDQQSQRVIDDFGSLVTDATEIITKIIFRTPSDIDQNGLMDFQTWENESSFTGLYRVIQVVSEFVRGQFVQTLDLIRLFHQESSKTSSQTNDDSREPTSRQEQGAEKQASERAVAEQQNALEFSRPMYGDSTASSSTATRVEPIMGENKVSGSGVRIPGPRIRRDETPLAETTVTEHIKSGFEALRSKISNPFDRRTTILPILEATNKLDRPIFATDTSDTSESR